MGCTSLTDIYSPAITPCEIVYQVFTEVPTDKVILHVPTESVEAYSTAEQWKDFIIKGGLIGESGIDDIEAAGDNAPAEYFNLNGVRVDNPENGFYIKRQGGKTTKVFVK